MHHRHKHNQKVEVPDRIPHRTIDVAQWHTKNILNISAGGISHFWQSDGAREQNRVSNWELTCHVMAPEHRTKAITAE